MAQGCGEGPRLRSFEGRFLNILRKTQGNIPLPCSRTLSSEWKCDPKNGHWCVPGCRWDYIPLCEGKCVLKMMDFSVFSVSIVLVFFVLFTWI